jgi:hypothetical protein
LARMRAPSAGQHPQPAMRPKTAAQVQQRNGDYLCEVTAIQSHAGAGRALDVTVRCAPVDVHRAARRRDAGALIWWLLRKIRDQKTRAMKRVSGTARCQMEHAKRRPANRVVFRTAPWSRMALVFLAVSLPGC